MLQQLRVAPGTLVLVALLLWAGAYAAERPWSVPPGVYRRIATVLIVSLIVPYGFNRLYNFDVGPFGRIDLTPFLLVGSCLVLVWACSGSGCWASALLPEAAEAVRNPGTGGNGCPRSWC